MAQDIQALYHYTSIRGFKGIIESSCIHATNIRYLNDSQEFVFGLNYLSEFINNRHIDLNAIESKNTHLYDHFVEGLIRKSLFQFKNRRESIDYFLISFSSKPDILSQWRGYGRDNSGYCIKFNYGRLFYPSDSLDGLIVKVEYINPNDLSVAENEIEELKSSDWKDELLGKMPWLASNDIQEYKKMLKRMNELDEASNSSFSISLDEIDSDNSSYPNYVDMNDPNPAWYTAICTYDFFVIQPLLARIAYSWKDESFSEEDEYRLVIKRNEDLLNTLEKRPIKFKEGKTFLVPYVEIPYDFENMRIIEQVIVGPCPHPIESSSSAQQFLQRNLKHDVEVNNSKIPYRYW